MPNAIAVLDFVNVTGDAESAWLSAGIAETVTSDLRALGHFRVIDRWRVMEASRRTDGSLHGIADNLGARLAVVGSYQRNRSRVRITARVVDVSGHALADAKVDGPIDTIFSLQDQVVAQFSSELGLAAGGAAVESARDTASLDAYRAFSEGWIRLESLDVREIPDAIAHSSGRSPRTRATRWPTPAWRARSLPSMKRRDRTTSPRGTCCGVRSIMRGRRAAERRACRSTRQPRARARQRRRDR